MNSNMLFVADSLHNGNHIELSRYWNMELYLDVQVRQSNSNDIYLIYYMLTCRDKGEVKVRTDINVKEIVKAMSPNTPAPPASAWDEGLTITMECQVTYSFLLQY